ncbi:acyl-CoA synthetase [Pseudohongiella acticola]|jgi:fatty-acyl-CoA synthase|uniref:acyl-CoA synthetase n=1 Tax=Pseudohongiella acticola TaxID=1524254 RepID=UPI0030EE21F8
MNNPILDTMPDIEAFEKIPLTTQFPAQSAFELIEQSAALYGDDPALDFLLTGRRDEIPQTLSFNDLADVTRQTANLLSSLGLQGDEAVSILLPILPQSHPLILGSQVAGIANPINPMLEPGHMAEIIQAAGARVIACLAPSDHVPLWDKLLHILPNLPDIHTILVVHQEGLTDPCSMPEIAGRDIKLIDYNTAVAEQDKQALTRQRDLTADTIAACFHTGGTTGKPKIAQLTHGNMAYLGQLSRVLNSHLGRQTALCGLPLFHIFGVIILGIGAFAAGNRIVLMTPSGFRNPEVIKNLWHHVARFQANSFAAVPTVLTALAQVPVGDEDTSSLQRINSGAAPLSPAFEQRFEEKYQVAVTNGYGMTETTSLITRPPEFQPPGSVGLRLPYSRVRIAQLSGTRISKDCKTGESGVVLVKGPQVFAGYKAESDNAQAWVDTEWFNTGDLGYLDEQGFLYLTGRAKDLIIRGGHNIDPELIEEPLNLHPDVISATAVGMPDPYAGELPMAFVVTRPGSTITPQALLSYCEKEVSERAAIPKRIEFIDAMPMTAVGKIFRPALRQQISAAILQEHLEREHINAMVTTRFDNKKGLTATVALQDATRQEETEALLSPYNVAINVTIDG